MLRFVIIAALTLAATPALAVETTAAPVATAPLRHGQVVRDVSGARLGAIDSVASDGTIGLIIDGDYVRLPASVVTNVDGKAQTSLSKKEAKALR
ncbi:hypothetical protein [uncultured Sphingomonas sp.]|uniref:hypothetical protein n=1 Tax=uncultured Sphingomonas sp. TaxID=158754 RepID=UPI00262AD2CA|nr:hypothetical protein [uncultured Sphingomonas sp.]